jgi:polyhydroxyalkanoate synthesis regulator phasin
VECHRDPEAPAEEGTVELVMPQRVLCRGQPQYSIVFDKDSHRGRVPAQQILQKIGHAERDIDEFGDASSLAFLTSYEARTLVDEIIDESTSGESGNLRVSSVAKGGTEESGSSLVESVLQTVNEIMNNETAPSKLQQDSASEGSPDACYTDRDEGYVDKEDGYADNLIEETVIQVLRDRRTDESEDGMANVNAARLVESVLRTMDDVAVEDETTMDQPTTTSAAQNLVDDLMGDLWTGEVPDDASHTGSNASDKSRDFVASVVDSVHVDSDNDSVSEQSREFVDDVLQDLGVEDDQPTASDQSKSFVTDLLDDMKIEDRPLLSD